MSTNKTPIIVIKSYHDALRECISECESECKTQKELIEYVFRQGYRAGYCRGYYDADVARERIDHTRLTVATAAMQGLLAGGYLAEHSDTATEAVRQADALLAKFKMTLNNEF